MSNQSIKSVLAIIIYLIIVNLVALIMMGIDKRRSKLSKWRVPEKRLFGLAVVGGALGIWVGMHTFRHKTKHRSFKVGIPLLIGINALAGFLLIRFLIQL